MVTVQHILEELTQEVEPKQDLGDRFERLMQAFFYYQDLFDQVWLWQEYPLKS